MIELEDDIDILRGAGEYRQRALVANVYAENVIMEMFGLMFTIHTTDQH